MSKNAVKIDNHKSAVGGIDIDLDEGYLFCCGLDSALVYHYRIEDVNDPVFSQILMLLGQLHQPGFYL